jgi:hypothetical protein
VQKDFDYHNFISLEVEFEEDNFNRIVIFFLVNEIIPRDLEQWKEQIIDLNLLKLTLNLDDLEKYIECVSLDFQI